jgi:hypothetical protein
MKYRLQHWHIAYIYIQVAQKCSIDIQHGEAVRTWEHVNAAWTCSNWHAAGHTARTCIKNMQQGHAAWTCSMYMQQKHAARTRSMDMQYGHAVKICFKDMLQGHAALTLQHGHEARTR